uniref:Amastin surface glycofamily protein n=1 Tax=Syphacia muris TaxID=451379 RepID=A0A0N5AWG7_9BILA
MLSDAAFIQPNIGINNVYSRILMAFTGLHVVFLILSVITVIISLCLSVFAVYSPAWQVVELREFQAEHQHGLWQDCVRDIRHVTSASELYEEPELHCMYKFDDSAQQAILDGMGDNDAAAMERERHLFSGWHKLLLTLQIFSEFLVLCGIFTAFCMFKCRAALYAYGVILFLACKLYLTVASVILSLLADGIFLIEAMRVDVRFAQGAVGTYEQQIGFAFYLHIISTVLLAVGFVPMILALCTYKRRYLGSSSNYGTEIPGPPLLEKYSTPTKPSHTPLVRDLQSGTLLITVRLLCCICILIDSHGLWQDCVRRHLYGLEFSESAPTCMYKFDSSAQQAIIDGINSRSTDAAALEAEHHLFTVWHKIILFLIISGQFMAFISLFTCVYAVCYWSASVVLTITLFVSLLLSLIADGVFFISAMRVDFRFVQAAVGTYEQQVGYAFYVHLLGTTAFGAAFILALLGTIKFYSGKQHESRSRSQLPAPMFSSNLRYHPEGSRDVPLIGNSRAVTYVNNSQDNHQRLYRVTSA